jgi:dipeptidase
MKDIHTLQKLKVLLVAMTALLIASDNVYACTVMAAGKNATTDGSVIVCHSDDNELGDQRLVYVPARTYSAGAKRAVYYDQCSLGFKSEYGSIPDVRYVGSDRGPAYENDSYPQSVPLGYIPQVASTYAYFDGDYAIMNEKQLIIGECTCRAKIEPEPEPGKRIFYSSELSRVAMERCDNARDAIKLMGSLIKEYGYYATGETLIVGDKQEAWVMEMCAYDLNGSNGLWVAKRIPDDEFFVEANEFRIRTVDPDDENMMYSENLFEVCEAKGWWNPEQGKLDWLKTVSPGEYNHPYYSLRRVWRALDRVAPSLELSPWVKDGYTMDYPFSVKPDTKLSAKDIISLYRDHYEGTEFDQTLGPGAGQWGSPNRFYSSQDQASDSTNFKSLKGAWERPISVFYCGYFHVCQARSFLPDAIGGVCWFGPDRPNENFVLPFYAGITAVNNRYEQVYTGKFDNTKAFWVCDFVSNYADLKYCYMIKDIKQKQAEIEAVLFGTQSEIEQTALNLYNESPAKATAYLTSYCNTNAETYVPQWWELGTTLIMKYADGYINQPPDNMAQEVEYPSWWKKSAYFQHGPKTYRKRRPLPSKWYKPEYAPPANGND